MSATAPDPGRRQACARYWLLLAVALLGTGCAEAPLPEQGLRRDDCLRELSLANLNERLKSCNAVVAAFPKDPGPLNDRYLLHSLAGDDRAACADLRRAIELAASMPAGALDAQLRSDLTVRAQLCREDGNRAAASGS
ncbi:MAG: hypothetical protein KFB97_00645 [Cyanobium sp. M30B3]|jgi:hypothetical protein|nr:MAG: hypothetical protein KFB97_00645 [Cyanobium sp. M30B3]